MMAQENQTSALLTSSVSVTSAPTLAATNPGNEVPAPSCISEHGIETNLEKKGRNIITIIAHLNNISLRKPQPLLPNVLSQNHT